MGLVDFSRHAEICCRGATLSVRHLETGKNQIYFHGRECREFELELGEEFQIGRTTFRLESSPQASEPPGNFWIPNLRCFPRVRFNMRIAGWKLCRELPTATLDNSSSDKEFARYVVRMILDTLPRVDTVAVFDLQMESGRPKQMEQLCWEGRVSDQSRFSYSKKMIKACFLRKESVVHIWDLDSMAGQDSANLFTNPGQFDWSFAVPITQSARSRWCLFMSRAI